MNKLTDAEIVRALEICANDETDLCTGCPCLVDDCCTGYHNREDFLTMVLDLINRLKAKNKEFDEKIVIQMGAIDWQAKEINRQKADIKLLQKDRFRLRKALNQLEDYSTIAKTKAITALREKCVEHQDFHRGDDGVFRAYISIEDLDVIIDELQNIQ